MLDHSDKSNVYHTFNIMTRLIPQTVCETAMYLNKVFHVAVSMIKVVIEDTPKTITFASPPMTSNSQAKNYAASDAVHFVLLIHSNTMKLDNENDHNQDNDNSSSNSDDEDHDEDPPGPDDKEEKQPKQKIQKTGKKTTESREGSKDTDTNLDPTSTATPTSGALEEVKITMDNSQQEEKPKQYGTNDITPPTHK